MSEGLLYVACSCFREGRTSEPPLPPERLDLDRFGNVKRVVDASPEDSPEYLQLWRSGRACEHTDMQVWEELYHGRRREWSSDLVEDLLTRPAYRHIADVLHRPTSAMAEVLVEAHEAEVALSELRALCALPTSMETRIVIDEQGEASRPVDGAGFRGERDFARIGVSQDAYPESTAGEIGEIGVSGVEVVVRDLGSGAERIRSTTVEVLQDSAVSVEFGGYRMYRTVFIPPGTPGAVWRWAPRLSFTPAQARRRGPDMPLETSLRVETRDLTMPELDHDLAVFELILAASVDTGNPVVSYYTGCSGGYDIF